MGTAEETVVIPPATSKAPKTSSATANTTATKSLIPLASHDPDAQAGAHGYNEWLAAFQAYYQAGAQPPVGGFPHPYMWGGQPVMPPGYRGPHPSYGAMYPPGGMYGHPMYGQYGTPAPEAATGVEQGADGKTEAKSGEGAKLSTLKKSKNGKGGLQPSKNAEAGGKGNGVPQNVINGEREHDDETGTDDGGSTDASREENAQNLLGGKRSFEQMAMEAVGAPPYMPPPGAVSGAPAPTVGTPGPGGSLDMSLDYWTAGSLSQAKGGKQTSGSPSTSAPPAELWLTDEREVKRQRRKQSNRESARRSRLRKQAECEELGNRVETLTAENMTLLTELNRMTEECKRLQAENGSLVQKIRGTPVSEMGGAHAAAADAGDVAPVGGENEAVLSAKEIEESQNDGNGNITKPKEGKPAGTKVQEEQAAAT
ncbi:G-box-binding factor 1 isoform X2 [Physcomitrium patens]|uniref:G-box-binding factor 1 isoform X2 n=1 Tax=Physcomitrium patens TaxID=3218 RepID=UPI000D15B10D|nr:bZIP transcription factor 68-like isoform X2 [Physcomitrium patens]|eukprot:XP_024403171.1 bZIP transcription factor 68-like isoform X2 [Physcomitrella patens]